MAKVAGTMTTYGAVGDREDLEDAIYRITPSEAPLIQLIGTTKVTAVRHDWQTDKLATPKQNAQVEGDDYTFETREPTKRVANFTQISWTPVIVSETQDAVQKAGRDSELGYQVAKAGVELKKDMEFSCLSNVGSASGDDDTPRVSAGLPAWLTSNADRGAGGANGGYSANTGLVAAATPGTQRLFTKDLLDNVIQLAYQSGGNPTVIMGSPFNKRQFSKFMSDANVAPFRRPVQDNKKQGVILAAADVYQSDFGELDFIPNRVMSEAGPDVARNVFIIDTSKLARGVLRPMKQDTPAKTGDANKRVIKTEWTLVVRNEAAHGVIADTFGMTATA